MKIFLLLFYKYNSTTSLLYEIFVRGKKFLISSDLGDISGKYISIVYEFSLFHKWKGNWKVEKFSGFNQLSTLEPQITRTACYFLRIDQGWKKPEKKPNPPELFGFYVLGFFIFFSFFRDIMGFFGDF